MSIIKYNNKKSKLLMMVLILPVFCLLFFDIFYIPMDNNIEIVGYPLMFILLILAIALLFLFGGLLEKTKESKEAFKYGLIYILILMFEIFIVIYRMANFSFSKLM